jgi:hypothetical protein
LSGYNLGKILGRRTVDLADHKIGMSACYPGGDPLGATLLDADSLTCASV